MKDVQPPDVLAGRLGYLLKHAYVALAAELEQALAPYRLIPRELGVLALIASAGQQLSQLEIAESLGVDRTTMVGVVDSLEKKGYVERHRSDRDRRRNVVTLTPDGERNLADAEQARERVERDFLAPLDDTAAQALTSALLALHLSRRQLGAAQTHRDTP
ncbi:MarR family winged helix-turn-helix transcriptional regulator [Streptomyces mangrovisoli]|uniref:MarR family transcriptional regulator n=1 Tax=Streptomyces mangrovisoli TaxID=1428628 RepID=A0A1J4NYU4_9ACTN|nr:MarR family transcriptional regulator [Streptomyces mangrovisoli]OIJ67523.1 MarR family transcriptional regulator [Streptomyces mangrovisoli]